MDSELSEIEAKRGTYGLIKDTILAAAVAGVVTDTILHPFETHSFARHTGIKVTWSRLFKGLVPAVIGAAPIAATLLTTYTLVKLHMKPYVPPDKVYLVHLGSGAIAEMTSLAFKMPIEYLKKRHLSLHYSVSTIGITKRVRQSAGYGAFYRGYHAILVNKIQWSFISFPLWEALMNFIKVKYDRHELEPIEISLCGAVAGGIAAALTNPFDVAKTHLLLKEFKDIEHENIRKQMKMMPKGEQRDFAFQNVENKMKNIYLTVYDIYHMKGIRGLYAGLIPRVARTTLSRAIFFYIFAYIMDELWVQATEKSRNNRVPESKKVVSPVILPQPEQEASQKDETQGISKLWELLKIGQSIERREKDYTQSVEDQSVPDANMSRETENHLPKRERKPFPKDEKTSSSTSSTAENTSTVVQIINIQGVRVKSRWGLFRSKDKHVVEGTTTTSLSEEKKLDDRNIPVNTTDKTLDTGRKESVPQITKTESGGKEDNTGVLNTIWGRIWGSQKKPDTDTLRAKDTEVRADTEHKTQLPDSATETNMTGRSHYDNVKPSISVSERVESSELGDSGWRDEDQHVPKIETPVSGRRRSSHTWDQDPMVGELYPVRPSNKSDTDITDKTGDTKHQGD